MKFPIIQMYSKVARFNAIQYDKNDKPRVIANTGSGFFYTHENQAYFVTDRNYVIIEEKAFLPDSIIIHQNNIERQMQIPSIEGMEIPLYDKNERPVWDVLPIPDTEKRTLISISISPNLTNQTQIGIAENSFVATEQLPKEVFLSLEDSAQMTGNMDMSLSIPVSTGLSLADYFFYSDKSNEKELQKKIEKKYHPYRNYIYDDINQTIDVNFKINRKNFAEDMMEMVLVLLEQNMDKLKRVVDEQKKSQSDLEDSLEIARQKSKGTSELLQTHSNLMSELEKIMGQFQDVLEPSIFERMQTMFKILMTKQNRLAGLSLLVKDESDYIIVKHLIHKILEQLGRNIVFVQ